MEDVMFAMKVLGVTKQRFIGVTIGTMLTLTSISSIGFAGENVFQKIGDGPRREIEDIVTPNKIDKPSQRAPAPQKRFSATYRVLCMDATTGADRADNTITAYSTVSEEDAMNVISQQVRLKDICQANGDTSRVTKPGTGYWM
jgi:hypothetical protein